MAEHRSEEQSRCHFSEGAHSGVSSCAWKVEKRGVWRGGSIYSMFRLVGLTMIPRPVCSDGCGGAGKNDETSQIKFQKDKIVLSLNLGSPTPRGSATNVHPTLLSWPRCRHPLWRVIKPNWSMTPLLLALSSLDSSPSSQAGATPIYLHSAATER